MARRLLPIGIQSFRNIHESNCYYVDKTGYALRLVEEGSRYSLSRPRRFGKSLFLDTLKEMFEGSRELFEGLHVYERWDWSVQSPVVRLDFGSGDFTEPGYLHASVMEQLAAIERDTSTERYAETAPGRFRDLLAALHRQTGQAGCGAGRRVRQADLGRPGCTRHCAHQPQLLVRPVCDDQVL